MTADRGSDTAQLWGLRDFRLYWTGVVASEVGTRATFAANLFHVYELSGSTAQTGLIGLAQIVAIFLLSPLAGALADRLHRARLVQAMQLLSLLASAFLAVVTMSGVVTVPMILGAVVANSAAAAFDRPARQALVPVLVPRHLLVRAFAIVNPSRELAVLVGPALAGFLLAAHGPAAVYLTDVATYLVLIVALQLIHVPHVDAAARTQPVWHNIREGLAFMRRRPLILQLIGLDLSATVFGAYRVVLPALATDVLGVGAVGYGLLGAAPSAGALLGSAVVFRLSATIRQGTTVLVSTAGYGAAVAALALSPVFALSLAAAAGAGFFDAMATTIRHAVVQLETPDRIRGRVTSTYQVASRGGPAIGDMLVGAVAAVLGPVLALAAGAAVPVMAAAGAAASRSRVAGLERAEEAAA